jgi:DNA repair protein RadD
MNSGPGLSIGQFFSSLNENELRKYIDPGLLKVLDAIFGGKIGNEKLIRVACSVVDFAGLLSEESGRKQILPFLPENKAREFEDRVGRNYSAGDFADWSRTEITRTLEFFGILEDRIQPLPIPAIADVSPFYGLFDHQRLAVDKLLDRLLKGERRALLHLPTGVGKTRTAMHVVASILRSNESSVVIWLASGKELLEQAVLSFKDAWSYLGNRPLTIGCMWGDRMPNLDSFQDGFLAIGLAKGWSVISRQDPEWAVKLSQRVRLVVFDEAHQSIASTYRRITDELMLDRRSSLLGLSATPGRTWADIDEDGKLAAYYAHTKVGLEVPGENPIQYLIDHGYLAKPIFETLFSEPGLKLTEQELSKLSESLDIPAEIVATLSMSEQYVAAVLKVIHSLLNEGHLRILVFAATVGHAQVLTAILAVQDIRSHVVTGNTPARNREQAIRLFKSNDPKPMVLVNFGVLTTGFDAPSASAVVIARPTRSLVLYSQMVGRAIRGPKAGGTETCKIITVVDPNLTGFGDIAQAFLNWEDVWT